MNNNVPAVAISKRDSDTNIASLLKSLESREAETRDRALQTLRAVGPSGVRALTQFASGVTASENADDSPRRIRFAVILLFLFLPSLVYGFMQPAVTMGWGIFCALIYFIGHAMFEGAKEERQAQNRKWRVITAAFSAFNDVACLGALIEAATDGSLTVRAAARTALKRLLPQLTPENSEALTQSEREFLTGELSSTTIYQDSDYLIAILYAVGLIGPQSALPRVYQLLHSYTHETDTQRVREAARRCFERMATRTQWPDLSQTAALLVNFPIYTPDSSVSISLSDHLLEALQLTHLLNRATPEECARLDTKARRKIFAILGDGTTRNESSYPPSISTTPELIIACLRVVEQLRDTAPIRTVRNLALSDAATANQRAVRNAATHCLRVLDREVEKGIASGTLLRASSSPQAASNELLRAAQASESQTQAEQLLRADIGARNE